MVKNQIKKYKVNQTILHKGKHYKIGVSVDETLIDAKTLKRLESAEYITEDKGFPAIPKDANLEVIDKLIKSISDKAKSDRQKVTKVVAKLRKEEKHGLATTKEQASRFEYADQLNYVESLKKVRAAKIKEDDKTSNKDSKGEDPK